MDYPYANARPRPACRAPLLLLLLAAGACTTTRPQIPNRGLEPHQRGVASWYGQDFHGRRTANGERYDMNQLTAAHPTLPFGTLVEVRNLHNGRAVVVRINDRGPFAKRRVIDLSYGAAREIGLVGPGTAPVEISVVAEGLSPRYTVQVGAFSRAEHANGLQRELSGVFPEAVVRADGAWYRVHVGAFPDRRDAESLRRELAMMGFTPLVVVVP